jgi:hypothetical protein
MPCQIVVDEPAASVLEVALTEDVTSLILTRVLASERAGAARQRPRQDLTARHVAPPGAGKRWRAAPAVTTAAIEVQAGSTRDGGARCYGVPGARGFS